MLPDNEILREIEVGLFKVEPFDPSLVQPASIDLRLYNQFLTFDADSPHDVIDPARRQLGLVGLETRDDLTPMLVQPGQFMLASTFEKVTLPADLAGRVEGKSSLGRLGLMVHITAGFIDPGFVGRITLELSNVAPKPIALWPGMLIAQLCLMRMTGKASVPYGSRYGTSKYQHLQGGPTASKSWVGFRRGLEKLCTTSSSTTGERPATCSCTGHPREETS